MNTYLLKKGFYFHNTDADNITNEASFIQKRDIYENGIGCKRSVDISIKEGTKKLTFYTTVFKDYMLGQQALIKAGFVYDIRKNLFKELSIIFQKANLTITAGKEESGRIITYRFELVEKAIPSSVRFAEDLLQFDSHQFLVSYFGENNVKGDRYYLTEKELKKCTVLFSGTSRQAIFVWNDETNLNNLAYIIISNKPPTEEGLKNEPLPGNEWQLKNGVYPGMGIKDLLRINENDFSVYGNKSDLAFLVKPDDSGKINFRKTALMLSCPHCYDDKIFNQKEVSALALAQTNLPIRVFDVVLFTSKRE